MISSACMKLKYSCCCLNINKGRLKMKRIVNSSNYPFNIAIVNIYLINKKENFFNIVTNMTLPYFSLNDSKKSEYKEIDLK